MPLIRALWLSFPGDAKARTAQDCYLWGDAFLVAPVTEKDTGQKTHYLPAGTWWDYWTGARIEGGRDVTRDVDLATLPLYLKAGAIVPMGPVKQHTGTIAGQPVTFTVYPGADGRFTWYEDDGASFDYENGAYLRVDCVWNDAARTLTLTRDANGSLGKDRKLNVQLKGGRTEKRGAECTNRYRSAMSQGARMTGDFDRRDMVKLFGVLSAGLGPADTAVAQVPSGAATIHRKNVVGVQVKPWVWTGEGIDNALDTLQQKANVNTIFCYTFDGDPNRISQPGANLPDHGVLGPGGRTSGAFFDYDPKYFQGTPLNQFRSHDDPGLDVIRDVAPKAKARGMDFFGWDYNNAFPSMMRWPGYAGVAEIDVYGKPTTSACFNHPDYRAHLLGKVRATLEPHADLLAGFMWGCERMGPLDNLIGGIFATSGISCFCSFCTAKGKMRGIAVDRARAGYVKLDQYLRIAARHERPADGFFVTFMRILLEYPEVLAWHTLWTDSYHEMRAQLVRRRQEDRAAKAVRLPHDAEHHLQPVLQRDRRLCQSRGLCRFSQDRLLQQCRRPAHGALHRTALQHRLRRCHARRAGAGLLQDDGL